MALHASLPSSSRNEILKEIGVSMDIESNLSSSPLSLAAMSQLNLVAADAEDFSLLPPGDQGSRVQHLRHPQSFKATVMQVSNVMYKACLSTHETMGKIALSMSPNYLPDYIRNVKELLLEGSPQEIKDELPEDIRKIRKLLDLCIDNSSSVVKKYEEVMDTTSEMAELTITTLGMTGNDLKDFRHQQEIQRIKKIQVEKKMSKVAEDIKLVEKQMLEEETNYKNNRDEIGTWNQVLKSTVTGLSDTVLGAGHIMTMIMGLALAVSFLSLLNSALVTAFTIIAVVILKPQNYFRINSQSKLSIIRKDFEEKRTQLEKCKEEELKDTLAIHEIAKDMADLQNREKTADDTIKIAKNALAALGDARNHWSEMLLYFMNIRNFITVIMEKPLEQFLDDSQRIMDAGQMSPRLKRRLEQCADESDQVIQMVLLFSSNYSKVSKEFIMPIASKFSKMIALNNKDEIVETQDKVFQSALSMQKMIEQMVENCTGQLELEE